MKAIILAAGQGTRLKKYTENLPKGMLNFMGKTIIERQIETFRLCGINDIVIVTGYASDKIKYKGVKFYHNDKYAETNMVESLMVAREEFDDDIIVSYSDILFEDRLLRTMISSDADFACAVDDAWKEYWKMRYGYIDFDTESLAIDKTGYITELGLENPPLESIDSRYIGLLRFSKEGLCTVVKTMENAYKEFEDKPWQQSGKTVRKAYMTDLLNSLIETGFKIKAIRFSHGWIEFDTNEDYERALQWVENGHINSLIRMKE